MPHNFSSVEFRDDLGRLYNLVTPAAQRKYHGKTHLTDTASVTLNKTNQYLTIQLEYRQDRREQLNVEVAFREVVGTVYAETPASMDILTVRTDGGGRGVCVWAMISLIELGLKYLAAAICKEEASIERYKAIAARHAAPAPTAIRSLMVHPALADLSDLRCPDDFPSIFGGIVLDLAQTETGDRILRALDDSQETVNVFFRRGQLKMRTKTAEAAPAEMWADLSCADGEQYGGLFAVEADSYRVQATPVSLIAIVGHELIHAVNDKTEFGPTALRVATASNPIAWRNEEEEMAIKGSVNSGQNADRRNISECLILRNLGMPLRYGHGAVVDRTLTDPEMVDNYGGGYREFYNL